MKSFFLFFLPFLLPLYVVRFHIGPIPTTLLEIIILLACCGWLLFHTKQHTRKKRFRDIRSSRFTFPIILLFIAGIISVLIAPNHFSAAGIFRAYLLEPVLIFFILQDIITTRADRHNIILGLLGVTFLITIWTILQRIGVFPIPSPWDVAPIGIRATGPFPYPNAVALFVVPPGAFFASQIAQDILNPQSKKKRMHLVMFLGFLSAFCACALAQSDGGMIALIASAGIALLLNKKTKIPTIIASILIILGIFSIPSIRNPLSEKIFFRDWSGNVRLVMWKEAETMLADHPLFGAGLGAYQNVIAPYHHAEWMEIFQYPHNILLNFWSELGLLGIISFGWILIRWYRSNPTIVLPVLTAILVHGLVDVPYFKNDLAILFWILVALTIHRTNTHRTEDISC